MEPAQGEITLLLAKWKEGESSAFEQLMPLVYPHLRKVAAAYVNRERKPDVLQATVLVHEVYLRLISQKKAEWADRAHFYTFAAKVMRMILTDHARSNDAQKRGGGALHVPLNEQIPWIKIGNKFGMEAAVVVSLQIVVAHENIALGVQPHPAHLCHPQLQPPSPCHEDVM